MVLLFVQGHEVFHGVLKDNLVLLFHKSFDVDLIFGENIFET